MSIMSSVIASHNNLIKLQWEKELEQAIKEKDWDKVEQFFKKFKEFQFSE